MGEQDRLCDPEEWRIAPACRAHGATSVQGAITDAKVGPQTSHHPVYPTHPHGPLRLSERLCFAYFKTYIHLWNLFLVKSNNKFWPCSFTNLCLLMKNDDNFML